MVWFGQLYGMIQTACIAGKFYAITVWELR